MMCIQCIQAPRGWIERKQQAVTSPSRQREEEEEEEESRFFEARLPLLPPPPPPPRLNDSRGGGDFFRCMQKKMEREIERIFFRSRADNRAEVIGEKRGEEGGSRVRVARERRWRKKTRPAAAAAAAAPWGVTGGAAATATADEVVRRRRERESRLQVFRSLMCDLPQTRQSVPPFPSGSAGIKESALGPPSPRSPSPSYKTLPVFRIIPPQPANFLSRERERGGESLSAFGFPDVSSKRRKTCQGRRREGGREKRPR